MKKSSSSDTVLGNSPSPPLSPHLLPCTSHRGKSSYEKKGASNTEELKAILFGTLMISRLKRNILTQLPPKRRHIVNVEVADENVARHLMSLSPRPLAPLRPVI
jgi:hypothetical protein